jgi:hypothetical protein
MLLRSPICPASSLLPAGGDTDALRKTIEQALCLAGRGSRVNGQRGNEHAAAFVTGFLDTAAVHAMNRRDLLTLGA